MLNIISHLSELGIALTRISQDQLPRQIELFTNLEKKLQGIGLIPSAEMGIRGVNELGRPDFMLFRTWKPSLARIPMLSIETRLTCHMLPRPEFVMSVSNDEYFALFILPHPAVQGHPCYEMHIRYDKRKQRIFGDTLRRIHFMEGDYKGVEQREVDRFFKEIAEKI